MGAFDDARRLLDAVVAVYGAAGVGLPDRRYVSAGPPAADCEQVTVHMAGTYGYEGRVTTEVATPVGDRARATLTLRARQYVVTVLRCVPTVADGPMGGVVLPTVAAEEAAAACDECGSVSIGRWAAVPSSGGIGGGQLTVTIGV